MDALFHLLQFSCSFGLVKIRQHGMMVDDRILGRQHFNSDSVAIAVGY